MSHFFRCDRTHAAAWGALAGLLALVGCQSYEIVQRNIFSDDDGRILRVAYGRADRDHESTFISPVNGKEMPFRTKLVVEVEADEGPDFRAWQCMNFTRRGTMYRSTDEDWMFLAGGFSATLYQRQPDGRYLEVYRGVLCDTADISEKKESKWKKIKPEASKVRTGAAKKPNS